MQVPIVVNQRVSPQRRLSYGRQREVCHSTENTPRPTRRRGNPCGCPSPLLNGETGNRRSIHALPQFDKQEHVYRTIHKRLPAAHPHDNEEVAQNGSIWHKYNKKKPCSCASPTCPGRSRGLYDNEKNATECNTMQQILEKPSARRALTSPSTPTHPVITLKTPSGRGDSRIAPSTIPMSGVEGSNHHEMLLRRLTRPASPVGAGLKPTHFNLHRTHPVIPTVGRNLRCRAVRHNDVPKPARPYLSTFNMLMKASCGISTLPTFFIRFLPSACCSSSFRLRVTSPP